MEIMLQDRDKGPPLLSSLLEGGAGAAPPGDC